MAGHNQSLSFNSHLLVEHCIYIYIYIVKTLGPSSLGLTQNGLQMDLDPPKDVAYAAFNFRMCRTQAEPSNPIGVSHMVITHLEQQGFASASGEEYHRYKKKTIHRGNGV